MVKKTKCIEFRDNTNNKYALKVVNSTLRLVAFEVSQIKPVSSYHFSSGQFQMSVIKPETSLR